jgi:MerR family transcriptional regulator, heat shock protein HspR
MAMRRYEIVLCRHETQQLTLDALAAHADMHPGLVQQFVELGLIEHIGSDGVSSVFDASAVPRLRMIRRLRESLGINLAGVAVILDLRDKFCALQRENETLRSRY